MRGEPEAIQALVERQREFPNGVRTPVRRYVSGDQRCQSCIDGDHDLCDDLRPDSPTACPCPGSTPDHPEVTS